MKTLLSALVMSALSVAPAMADDVLKAKDAARDWRVSHEREILNGYADFLRLPNYGRNEADMAKNATYIRNAFEARGFSTKMLGVEGATPSVYAERLTPDATRTILFYIHYDGQPVNPQNWVTPPYEPTYRDAKMEEGGKVVKLADHKGPVPDDWRIYARSASDDKAPVAALMAALDGLKAAGMAPKINIKLFFEGEEELGSPNLRRILEAHKDTLKSDSILFMDGPQDPRGVHRVVLGVRGSMGMTLRVYGPDTGLHSGHFGNFAPNPAMRLAYLLTSMRDEDSHILIDGYYDDVKKPTAKIKALVEAIPDADAAIRESIGVHTSESQGRRYEEAILYPALNVKGIYTGKGGTARNAIEDSATASLGFRMVPGQTPKRVQKLVEAHIKKQGYHIVRDDPDHALRMKHAKIARVNWRSGYRSVQVQPDHPWAKDVIRISKKITDDQSLTYPILGGSLPLATFEDVLGVPLIVFPIANADNSQHAPNENLRIGNLWQAIELYAGLLVGLGEE